MEVRMQPALTGIGVRIIDHRLDYKPPRASSLKLVNPSLDVVGHADLDYALKLWFIEPDHVQAQGRGLRCDYRRRRRGFLDRLEERVQESHC